MQRVAVGTLCSDLSRAIGHVIEQTYERTAHTSGRAVGYAAVSFEGDNSNRVATSKSVSESFIFYFDKKGNKVSATRYGARLCMLQ